MKSDLPKIYKLRALFARLDQLTWTLRDANQRFPLTTPENQRQITNIYLAMVLEVEDIYLDLKAIKDEN